ncbi:tetratricopeptide repeat protein [Roseateles sp. BYS180W]|uniref:Tetratricopeptide repeat protein n=1 Tax=Roseateles rivi TaxID=3299028 RepID=A0ABW7FV95_9BURK
MNRTSLRATLTGLLLGCFLALDAGASTAAEAQALWQAGKRELAVQAAESALQASPQDLRLRFSLASMLLDMQQLDRAQALLKQLTQDYPDLPDPHNNLAVVYAARGDLEQARAQLMLALTANPEHPQALENLGDVLLRLAQQAYERAQKSAPGDTSALVLKLQRLRALNSQPSVTRPPQEGAQR